MRTKLKDTAGNFLLNELLRSRFPVDIDSFPANISQSDMSPAIFLILFLLVLPLYVIILTRKARKKLPPGSFGLPFIGQSLSFLHALRTNTAEHWLRERVRKYGAVSKMNLLGTPTLLLHGQAANKFVYTCDQKILAGQQPTSIRKICGERNILELTGDDHRCVRGALLSFLKPEVLKQYVGKIDEEVRKHMKMHWHGKEQVQAMPLMKTLTFSIMSSLLFGIEEGDQRRDALVKLFQQIIDGIFTIPVNLPFTRFNRSLQASKKVRAMLMNLIREKGAALEQHTASPNQDLISCLLSIRNESVVLSDEEIIDNAIIVMIAGHDTSAILITFFIRLLANDPSVYATIVQEQEEIAKNKASGTGELLTWEDLAKMKQTWRVAMEILRTTPPIFCSFRKVLEDFEYEGYIIPKGWQVMWAACMTHMDDQLFPDALKFDPTRFEKQAAVPPFSFVAFGGGPRTCPGNEFARIETLVIIHYLVTQFTWKLCCSDNSFSRDPLPVFRHGLEIQVKPKNCATG
ncbi:Taxane 13-alpha-hydroxylase [Citrus sinensis]|uniref:Taxane 13-alpha-hydroxylase n=3 Tax=Citrus sinensis TaxID=2711 RepID=A0ACB8NF55_CITSI|nr:Taxane 13-alpha-hydroxylase [Citrus sinensis]